MHISELIPGYAQLGQQFRESQAEAFLRLEPPLCGIAVVPLTPRISLELELAGNAFLCGGQVTGEDVLQFVHRVSIGFERGSKKQRKRIVRHLWMAKAIPEIDAYIARARASMPESGGSDSEGAWASYLVDALAKRYGWGCEEVLDTPWRIIWQQYQRILEEVDTNGYRQQNPEKMKARQKWLEEQAAKTKAGAN